MTDDLPDHTNYSLIKATDESGNIVTVLVDASGRMYAVMKGDYAGSLKTLALDDQGRIQAVLTDPEDVFGNPNYIGAGELAARLGSIKSYEHHGNVILMDDFEDATLKWACDGTGVGHSEARSNAHAKAGSYSLKLQTGDAVNDDAYAYGYLYYPPGTKFGIEYAFALGDNLSKINMYSKFYNGTHYYESYVYYEPPNDRIVLRTRYSGYVILATGVNLKENDYMFHVWKIVLDMATHKYISLYLDNTKYDISAYHLPCFAQVTAPHVEIVMSILNHVAEGHYAYIDNVIITQNEP